MTTPHQDQTNEYLWDPASAASASPDSTRDAQMVQDLERMLAPLHFDPETRPLEWREAKPVRATGWKWTYGLAAAAVALIGIGWLVSAWKWSWPAGRAWPLEVTSSTSAEAGQLAVGSILELPDSTRARVNIARIGTMDLEGGARVLLRYTQGTRHRLTLERGTVRVRTWAPPGSVAFQTPTGEVIDLGCEFDLTVEADRTTLRVLSGWVQLENTIAEVLIPAGASSEMRHDRAPGIAVYDDARPEFSAAVRALESGAGDPNAHLEVIVSAARPRDVYTLLMLAAGNQSGSERLLAVAADLWPPPSGVTVNGIVRCDRDGLWRWRETLPLPPPKSWLRNWRDALPEWLR